mmetsp:Transcript_59554/g.140940  ORF Transcript_59554/g.140940 Transcript_59554/m.140940 type:complete len:234 (-) Transcript_59554:47-748(-)
MAGWVCVVLSARSFTRRWLTESTSSTKSPCTASNALRTASFMRGSVASGRRTMEEYRSWMCSSTSADTRARHDASDSPGKAFTRADCSATPRSLYVVGYAKYQSANCATRGSIVAKTCDSSSEHLFSALSCNLSLASSSEAMHCLTKSEYSSRPRTTRLSNPFLPATLVTSVTVSGTSRFTEAEILVSSFGPRVPEPLSASSMNPLPKYPTASKVPPVTKAVFVPILRVVAVC